MEVFLQEFEAYFQPVAKEIENFAQQHHLLIQKYVQDAPIWSLCFEHSEGGFAKVDIYKIDDNKLAIQGVWWLDSYEEFSRSIKWTAKMELLKQIESINSCLEKSFQEILSWTKQDLERVSIDYKPYWSKYSKEEFENMNPRWPKAN